MTNVDEGDLAVAVCREDNFWAVDVLPIAFTADLDGFVHALRQQPSHGVIIGLAAVADDFFVVLRVVGSEVRLLLSDVTASVDFPLARQALARFGLPVPGDDELDQVLPVGDMSIFADLGVDEMELGALAGDLDIYPDEALFTIAKRLGFADPFQRALDATLD